MGRVTSAKPLLEALGKTRAEDAHVQRLLGILREKAGDEQGALEALRKAATLASEAGDQRKLGNAEARQGDYAAAADALKKAAEGEDKEAITKALAEFQAKAQKLGEVVYKQQQEAQQAGAADAQGAGQPGTAESDEPVDADFEVKT